MTSIVQRLRELAGEASDHIGALEHDLAQTKHALAKAKLGLAVNGTTQDVVGWMPIETVLRRPHGFRFLSWSADVGQVVCDVFNGAVVLAWNQQPYSAPTHWQFLPPSPAHGD